MSSTSYLLRRPRTSRSSTALPLLLSTKEPASAKTTFCSRSARSQSQAPGSRTRCLHLASLRSTWFASASSALTKLFATTAMSAVSRALPEWPGCSSTSAHKMSESLTEASRSGEPRGGRSSRIPRHSQKSTSRARETMISVSTSQIDASTSHGCTS